MANLAAYVPENNNEMYGYKRLTATGSVKASQGQLGGFIVATGTPTVTIYDSLAASGTVILNGMVCSAATPYPLPVGFNIGCYVSITGTCDITFFYV